ncbi:microfibril-associated glycoprotein 3 [Ictalurus punctatus]|uniref:Microfibril-associated glycoprotein 3 n=1 Tax=Ictalurus punctatus TaxID=7998 RepID=A0A2D0SYE4_ICTPU|nr:microfibril-associated glycoprotein 3 [Ictalurus punctatus]XP_053543845.1 microfibril-associated glycoprotein 3 [Ictalurus punctatus]XP_053543846.1 microfibril-associated glycoprotein 3 [Ictalurus punctatus]
MKPVLFLSMFCALVCVRASERMSVVSVKDLSDLPSLGIISVKEGASVVIKCNASELHEHIAWYDSKGHVLNGEDSGGDRVTVHKDSLNISSVSFEDRGRYTCISLNSESISNYTVTLRVSYTYSGLGFYYIIVCLVTFTITIILNMTRLCMINTHLRKTERAINDFFRTDGAEKLQKALEVAKRIPIVTSMKTLELAKVTQFKTLELAKQMEELARSVPLPPLILTCTTAVDEAECIGPVAIVHQEEEHSEQDALNGDTEN